MGSRKWGGRKSAIPLSHLPLIAHRTNIILMVKDMYFYTTWCFSTSSSEEIVIFPDSGIVLMSKRYFPIGCWKVLWFFCPFYCFEPNLPQKIGFHFIGLGIWGKIFLVYLESHCVFKVLQKLEKDGYSFIWFFLRMLFSLTSHFFPL